LVGRRKIGHHDGEFIAFGAGDLLQPPALRPTLIRAFGRNARVGLVDSSLSYNPSIL
jgi:hypothetical protein